MQVVGNYNGISAELKALIPPLKGVQVLQMLNGTPNQEEDQIKEIPFVYGKTQLPTQFTIKDPFTNNFVSIILAEGWTSDKQPTKAKCVVAGAGETHFRGKFPLVEGKLEDEELWEILMLSPYREGSPCQNASIKPLYKLLSPLEESKSFSNKYENLKKAIDLADKMDEKTCRDFAAAMNWDYNSEFSVLQGKLRNFVREDTDKFIQLANDEKITSKSLIKRAIDAGVLKYAITSGDVLRGDNLLVNVGKKDGAELIASIQAWFDTAPNGEKVLESVEKELLSNEKSTTEKIDKRSKAYKESTATV